MVMLGGEYNGASGIILTTVQAAANGMTFKSLPSCTPLPFVTELFIAESSVDESELRIKPTQPLDAGWYEVRTGSIDHLLHTGYRPKPDPDGGYRTRIGVGHDLVLRMVEFRPAHGTTSDYVVLTFSEPAVLALGSPLPQLIHADGGVSECRRFRDAGLAFDQGDLVSHWTLNCGPLPDQLTLRVSGAIDALGQPLRNADGGVFEWTYDINALPYENGAFVGPTGLDRYPGHCP